jgi:hypothetical protein
LVFNRFFRHVWLFGGRVGEECEGEMGNFEENVGSGWPVYPPCGMVESGGVRTWADVLMGESCAVDETEGKPGTYR